MPRKDNRVPKNTLLLPQWIDYIEEHLIKYPTKFLYDVFEEALELHKKHYGKEE